MLYDFLKGVYPTGLVGFTKAGVPYRVVFNRLYPEPVAFKFPQPVL